MKEASRNRTSVLVLGLGRIAQLAIVFLTFRLITGLLPQAEVGFYFLLQALAGFFLIFVISPLGTYLNREIHEWERIGQARQAVKHFLIFSWVSSLVAGALVGLIGLLGISAIGNHESLVQTIGTIYVVVLGSAIANTIFPLLNILGRPFAFVSFTVFTQAMALAVSIFVARHFVSASAWWLTTGLIQIVFGTIAYWWVSTPTDVNGLSKVLSLRAWLETAWKFASPIAIANLAVWGLIQGYRPLVEGFAGLNALAIVGLGLGLSASITAAFEALVQQVFLPRFYKNSHSLHLEARKSNWNQTWRAAFLPYLGLTIVLAGLAPAVVAVISGDSFPQAAHYLAIGAFAELARMSGNLLTLHAQSERNLKPTQLPYWIGALVALFGCFAAIQIGNMELVAWSLVAGQSVATILLAWRIARIEMFRISILATTRFVLIPLILVFSVQTLAPIWALAVVGSAMAAMTLHYWRQEGRR